MIHKLPIVVTMMMVLQSSIAFSQAIAIKVVDEKNTGVYSQVFYEEQAKPRPFWTTDQRGELQRSDSCGKTHTLKAHPFDAGTYFDSLEVPCASRVTLHVVSRSTPKGLAINWKLEDFKFPDGSPGVLVLKAGLETNSTDQPNADQCEVTVQAVVNQLAYKVEGDRWTFVKQGSSALSKAFSGSTIPDTQNVTLPSRCEAAKSRVITFESVAADRLDKNFGSTSVKKLETLNYLGLQ